MEAVVAGLLIDVKLSSLLQAGAAALVRPLRRPVLLAAKEMEEHVGKMTEILRHTSGSWYENEEASCLIKEMVALIYDAEDCLDEYLLLQQGGGGGWGSWWSFLCSGGPFFGLSILSQMHEINRKLRPLAGAVASIGLSDPSGSSSLGGDPPRHLRVSDSMRWRDGRPGPAVARFVKDYELMGVEAPKNRVMHWLLGGGSELSVIAVIGMGGIGKTTLAKAVFNDRRVTEWFDHRAWVYVSQSYDVRDLLRAMLVQLSSEHVGLDALAVDILVETVTRRLRSRRYVIVLDDVWDSAAWEAIRLALPDDKTGSRIVVTSRLESVARSSTGNWSYVYRLGVLSDEESWLLFCRHAFPLSEESWDSTVPRELQQLARGIVTRCGGVPLALVTMGSLLRDAQPSEWMDCLRLMDGETSPSVLSPLQLSYNYLNYDLRRCLLYLTIYPHDYKIRRGHLLRLWAAEGFVTEGRGLTAEEVAENYLNELINRSMIQALEFDPAGRARCLVVHDLIRDLIITKSTDENFVALSCEQSTAHSRKIRRLSVIDGGMYVPRGARLSRVRTLVAIDQQKPLPQLMPVSFARLKLLKVLDLEGANLWEFPAGAIRLRLLKYLSLKNTHISCLPRSIGTLQSLETLDLRGTQVRELPDDIVNLKKLRHLLAAYCKPFACKNLYQCPVDVKVPAGIRELTALVRLSGINITGVAAELENLTKLRTLAVTGLGSVEDALQLCHSMDKLCNSLISLAVHFVFTQQNLDLINSPPILLERLYLDGPLVRLPDWVASLQNVVKIVLQRSGLRENPLKHLQVLPNLQHLELWHDVYIGKHLCFGKANGGFPRLRVLNLKYIFGLEMVTINEGALASLEKFVIESCWKLKQMPSGLQHLVTLKEFYLLGASDACVKRSQRGVGEDWHKVAHIPLVRIDEEPWRA